MLKFIKKMMASLFFKYMIIFLTILFITSIIVPYIVLLSYNDSIRSPLDLILFHDSITMAFVIRNGLISVVIGTIFITVGTKVVVKPINTLSEAAKKVATGDFNVVVELEDNNDAIVDLTENFNRMVAQLSKNENLHKDFISNLSHEFKTPISSIAGYAEMLKTPDLSDEKRLEYAEIITKQTTRLSKLSANLLKLSELENKAISINQSTFSLDEQIRDAILLLQNDWEEKMIHLEIELDEVHFKGDRELLYQVWVNIIENAVKFTPVNGEIKIHMQQEDRIKITINDNGVGIREDELPQIFDRFYKTDASRSTKGTGLGLSIVKQIITVHGGEIEVESEDKVGTQFTIIL